jgi:nicotinate phosphoribosyltransferase
LLDVVDGKKPGEGLEEEEKSMTDQPAIRSLLDNDLYKFTMQQAVLQLFPNSQAKYTFTDRGGRTDFNEAFKLELVHSIAAIGDLRLQPEELMWLRRRCPYLKEWYLQYLRNYQFDSSDVGWSITDGQLSMWVTGPWYKTILWEVPLLAIVSEAYFKTVDVSWRGDDVKDFRGRTALKGARLESSGSHFADFGTRRRRSFEIQRAAVEELKHSRAFVGTSNVHLAQSFGVRPIGTMAHEWVMGISAIRGLRHANRYALEDWVKVYDGRLGIALTDTYGLDAFLSDFGVHLSKLFDGVRHDSGSPLKFASVMAGHYKKMGVDPRTKTIVFSDGLDVSSAQILSNICDGRIGCSFGIGTHLTNDFPDSPALNIVMKLRELDGIPVVKLSDSPGKEMGEASALAEAEYVFHGKQIRMEG